MTDKIIDIVGPSAPCRNCSNYGDGEIYWGGEAISFEEGTCLFNGYSCPYGCSLRYAIENNFPCFEPREVQP